MKNLIFLFLMAILYSCTTTSQKSDEESSGEEKVKSAITLIKAPTSLEFPNASLTKKDISTKENDSSYSVNYSFDVVNYELGTQTEDADTRGIANSGKGQHIHFIVNNGPYSAHYMPGVSDQLDAGNYVVLAFLSRSYHESVKNPSAFHVENLNVGDVDADEVDLTAQHLFYSRPKGTYKGSDTEKVMLDFYLLNTTISPDGNKVRATINGEESLIDEWVPYYIKGLPKGEVTIKLELMGADGNEIEGPFNSVERKITLAE